MELKELQYEDLGRKIYKLLDKNDTDIHTKEIIRVGKEFSHFSHMEPRELLKFLTAENGLGVQLALIQWLSTKADLGTFYTKGIKLQKEGAVCTIQFFNNLTSECLEKCRERKKYFPFYVEDATPYFDKFIVLDGLYSFKKGAGKLLLKQIQSIGLPIILQAGFVFESDYDYANSVNNWEHLDHLVDYYKQAGFQDVNDKIGNYEDSVIMLYNPGGDKLDTMKIFQDN